MQGKSDNDGTVNASGDEKQPGEDRKLDEALEESFPASDPLPVTPQAEPPVPAKDTEIDRNAKTDKVTRK